MDEKQKMELVEAVTLARNAMETLFYAIPLPEGKDLRKAVDGTDGLFDEICDTFGINVEESGGVKP